MLKIVSTFTDIGKRDYMQDELATDGDTFVVCDGLGWHDGSGKAAKIAVDTIIECKDDLDVGFNLADHRIIEFHDDRYGKPKNLYKPHASTTAVAVKLIDESSLEWMSVGDSFILLYRDGVLNQINPLDEGGNGGLTNFLGIRTYAFSVNTPFHRGILKIHKGDVVILCSDGCEDVMNTSVNHANNNFTEEYPFASVMGDFILEREMKYQDNIAIIALQF